MMVMFLAAYFLYNDGVQTVISMAAIYGRNELGLTPAQLLGVLLLIQFLGIPGTLFFGALARRTGPKRVLIMNLLTWCLVLLWASQMGKSFNQFLALGVVIAMIQGSTQAISRSMFSRFVPPGKEAEFFSFFGIFAKFSAITGPAVFAIVAQRTGSMRKALISLLFFFISGLILLFRVKPENGRVSK